MNSKERMLRTFKGQKTDTYPVAPHWWGMYKFQLAGIASDYEDESRCRSLRGAELAAVDSLFYETFKPDTLHLSGDPGDIKGDEYKRKKAEELKQRIKLLDSKALIDEYVEMVYPKADEIRTVDVYEHVRILSGKYGGEVFITVNEGNPICGILDPHGAVGFEEGLIAMTEKPDMMEYLIFREYELMLERVEVLKECGCHGYIGSETYCTPDLISPKTYRDLVFPAQNNFYEGVAKIGLVPITYFLGDIVPLIGDINKLGVKALLVEEPKKTFNLDVVEIRKKLSEDITLFGNIDSIYTMLLGTPEDVTRETCKQLEASKYGRFVTANGSPVTIDTTKENILAMISAARPIS